jgi:Arm DNA-binding domain
MKPFGFSRCSNMEIAKLTALQVEKVIRSGLYNDGGGLYLRVARGGSKGWIFRYALGGRTHDMGLGSVDTFSLKQARERARQCRELCYDGIDPIERRRARRRDAQLEAARVMTFRQCAEAYIAAHETSWRNPKHAAQWPSTMARYVYPVFGRLSVQAIDTGLVLKVIEPIWTTKTETANRVRGRIEAVLDWAAARAPIGKVRTRLAGVAISKTYCRGNHASPRSSTTRLCPTRRSAPSWASSQRKRGSPHAPSNSSL